MQSPGELHYHARVIRLALALVVSSFVLAGCGSVSSAAPSAEYTFVQLKTGSHTPASKEESQQIFGGHFANMQRLAREGALLLAGPYGQNKSDPALRGVFVLATADRAQATKWAASDPGFQAGVFRFEFAAMATTAALREQLAAELARENATNAAGQTPKPGASMRGYVLLTAANGDAAAQALAGHASVLMFARLDGGRALVLLDAKDLAAATAAIAPLQAQLGAFTLDEWYATDLLVDLPLRSVK